MVKPTHEWDPCSGGGPFSPSLGTLVNPRTPSGGVTSGREPEQNESRMGVKWLVGDGVGCASKWPVACRRRFRLSWVDTTGMSHSLAAGALSEEVTPGPSGSG